MQRNKETQTELKEIIKPCWEALNLRSYILQFHPHIYREFKVKMANKQLRYIRTFSENDTCSNFREDGKSTKPETTNNTNDSQV